MHRSKQVSLFDHLVGSYLNSQWDCKPKCFGGFEVYKEFKLGRLHDWRVSRLFALENTAGVDTGLPPCRKIVRSIAHETADCHGLAQGVNRWHGMAGPPPAHLLRVRSKGTGPPPHP